MNETLLLKSLHAQTGIPWEFVDGEPDIMGGAWQLMPYDAHENGGFWNWHLSHARQWFDTVEEAAASLLRSWAAWQHRN